VSGPFVVTGASGFIGRAVTAELRRRQLPVVALSRSGALGTQHVQNYRDTPPGGVLIHLAEDPRVNAVDETCASEQAAVLTALLAKGFARVVYASSAAVYDDASEMPRRPGDATKAATRYHAGKLGAEQQIVAAGGVAVRLANVYGSGMHDGTVMADIIAQRSGAGAVALRDLLPVRDFIFIDDVARGFVAIALGTGRGLFNLGSGVGASVADLARLVLGPERSLVATAPGGRKSSVVLDIAETQRVFGWRPEVGLAVGLQRLLAA
jgi:UDP-glucose 4-epimerase